MKRTRWDKRPEPDKSIPSTSNWDRSNEQWGQEGNSTNGNENSALPSQTRTPRPLDYSKQSEENIFNKEPNETNKSQSENKNLSSISSSSEMVPEVTPISQHPWHFFPSHQGIYTSSNSQHTYHPHLPWSETHQNYYTNSNYHNGPSNLSMKWWNNGADPEKIFRPSTHWPSNSRTSKYNEHSINYDFTKWFDRYQSAYDRQNKNSNSHKHYTYQGNNRYYNKNDSSSNRYYRSNCRETSESSRPDYHGSYSWRNSGFESYSKHYEQRMHSHYKSFNDSYSKNNRNNSTRFRTKVVVEKETKKDSAAEIAKKKALAIAADRLKKTFLAERDKLKSSVSKKKRIISGKGAGKKQLKSAVNCRKAFHLQKNNTLDKAHSQKNNLDSTASVNESSCTSKDSDISIVEKHFSDGESVEIELSDSESNVATYDSDNCGSTGHTSELKIRRRHASDSCRSVITANKHNRPRRSRSYSTSQMVETDTNDNDSASLSSSIKNLFVKELLTMDRNSIKEFINNPKSRKAQFIMDHFMKMQRLAVSQKLNLIRFKNKSTPLYVDDDDDDNGGDDLQILDSITPDQLEQLPADIVQQVSSKSTVVEFFTSTLSHSLSQVFNDYIVNIYIYRYTYSKMFLFLKNFKFIIKVISKAIETSRKCIIYFYF